MDEDTFASLSVFVSEGHPVATGKGKTREGVSLFGLVDRTKSKQGSKVLRSWLSAPSQSLCHITRRADAVEFFAAPVNASLVGQLRPLIRDLCGLGPCVAAFLRCVPTDREWRVLRRGLDATAQVRPMLEALALHDHPSVHVHQPECLTQFRDAVLSEPVRVAESLLDGVVEFDSTTGAVSIRPGIDDTVDRLRDLREHMPTILDELAHAENRTYADILRATHTVVHAIYSPQIGFLTAVPLPDGDQTEQPDVLGEQFSAELRFRTFNAAYYKTSNCRRCDNRFGDVHTALADAENEVLQKVAQRIAAMASVLAAVAESAALVDALTAMAIAAVEGGWTRPCFDPTGARLELHGAKHPLLDTLATAGVVPNDAVFDESSNAPTGTLRRCVFLTGPNGSGKSVFMSTVACVALLAQCGSFVPAEHAVLPLFDSLQCHGHVPDSAQNHMSSFVTECTRVAQALARCTGKTLLLLDEFGKGTDPENGLALVAATLDYLAGLPLQTRPWTIFVSHFNNALDLVSDAARSCISPLTMQCIEDTDAAPEAAPPVAGGPRIVFLFRVVPGISSDSLSFHCARSAGMPEALVQRAVQVAAALQDKTATFASVRLLPSVIDPETEARQLRQYDELMLAFDRFDPEHDPLEPFLALCRKCR